MTNTGQNVADVAVVAGVVTRGQQRRRELIGEDAGTRTKQRSFVGAGGGDRVWRSELPIDGAG